MEKPFFDTLLDIVENIGAEIVAARAQLAGGQLLVSNVVEQQSLHRIDIGVAAALEFILDDVEQSAMPPFGESQCLQVRWPNVIERRLASGGLDRLRDGFHVQRPLRLIYVPGC